MAGTQRTPSRASSYAGSLDLPNNAPPNAALLGASKAFGKPAPKPKPKPQDISSSTTKGITRTNGALSAATAAGVRSKTNSPEHRQPHVRSTTSYGVLPVSTNNTGGPLNRSLLDVGGARKSRPQSLVLPLAPQSTAGGVPAASRVRPAPAPLRASTTGPASSDNGDFKTTPRPAAPPKPRRLSLHRRTSSRESIHTTSTTDAPILPTTSLVDLFERKSNNKGTRTKPIKPIVIKPHSDLAIRSPQPIRVSDSDGLDRALQAGMDDGGPTKATQHERGRQEAFPPQPGRQAQGGRGKTSTGGGSSKARRRSPSTYTGSSARRSTSQGLSDADLSPPEEAYFSASEDTAPSPSPPVTIRKRDSDVRTNLLPPTPSAHERTRPSPSPLRNSHNTIPSAPIDIKKPPLRPSISTPFTSSPSTKSIAATYNQLYPRRTTPLTSSPDLATAMVASNLASHRAPSPTKLKPSPPPLPQPRRHTHLPFSRTPSPSKKSNTMRHTLRASSPSASDSDDGTDLHPYGKHKKKRHLRPKHPNKHHEGTRKRWREAVTERERKRYEGLWAANRGLLLPPTSPSSDQVSNLVVRDLWSRSRLPQRELELIWDLVDANGRGALGKEEFVVGLWLVDQRLKGRKVPVRVGETVWASVRGIQGIKVKKFVGR